MHAYGKSLLLGPAFLIACSGTPDGSMPSANEAAELGSSGSALTLTGTQLTTVAATTAPTATTFTTTTVRPIYAAPLGTLVLGITPPDSDLRPDGAMRYYGAGATWGVQIDVVNIGTTPATGSSGRVSIGPYTYSGALYQYYGGTATAPNTVNPGERGYIKIDVPPNLLSLCGAYPVHIDLDHTMQAGANPFANDTRTVYAYQSGSSCRLTWYRPVNGATLGHEPDPKVTGKSLQDIVSSVEIARADKNRCSTCHNSNGSYPYAPTVAANGVSNPLIDPFQAVSKSQAWIGTSDPWLPKFLELPDSGSASAKPPYLKEAFRKWLVDGAIH